MEKLPAWATRVVAGPTARQGEQGQPWDDRRSQSRSVMDRICPRRSGLEWRERFVEPLQLGIAMDERRPSLGAPKAAAQRSSGVEWPHPSIAKLSGGVTMRLIMQRSPLVSGSARKGLALEGFEPCEGKLSRTVLSRNHVVEE